MKKAWQSYFDETVAKKANKAQKSALLPSIKFLFAQNLHYTHSLQLYVHKIQIKINKKILRYNNFNPNLGTWAEFNILNERMKKSWNDYLSSQPKAEVNWNRNAAPKPKAPPDPPKPKPVKKKPAQKQENPSKPEFEEIVFKTPPITPPPDQGPVKLAPKAKRDNEFWDFYDKGGKDSQFYAYLSKEFYGIYNINVTVLS